MLPAFPFTRVIYPPKGVKVGAGNASKPPSNDSFSNGIGVPPLGNSVGFGATVGIAGVGVGNVFCTVTGMSTTI